MSFFLYWCLLLFQAQAIFKLHVLAGLSEEERVGWLSHKWANYFWGHSFSYTESFKFFLNLLSFYFSFLCFYFFLGYLSCSVFLTFNYFFLFIWNRLRLLPRTIFLFYSFLSFFSWFLDFFLSFFLSFFLCSSFKVQCVSLCLPLSLAASLSTYPHFIFYSPCKFLSSECASSWPCAAIEQE